MRVGYARLLVFALVLAVGGCSTMSRESPSLDRCIWVTRWDYRTREDIRRIMANCATAGFTSVMFQVRGNGTVFYSSQLEVWSEAFDYRHPGFDPLASAIEEAHARGLQLHAWVNVIPGWRGDVPPEDARQLYASRPGWFLQDRFERPEPPEPGRYLGLNPCLPEVRRHLANVCREVAANYSVDGIHLDYIRFTYRDYQDGDVYPQDPRSLEIFTKATGAGLADRVAFERWKTDCMTELVSEIHGAVSSVSTRRVMLSAAVFADPEVAVEKGNQDWGEWADRGLVDALFPMNYADDNEIFTVRARLDVETGGGVPVVMGVGTHRHDSPEQTLRQMDAAIEVGASGVAVFGYSNLFGPLNAGPQERETAMRRLVTTWNLTRER